MLVEGLEALRQVLGPLEHADLAEEAVEEADVAGPVGELGAEEDPLRLGRSGAHDRAELVGDLLLADEEAREPVHPLEALRRRDALVPVDPVLGEVEVLGAPLLLLPEVVELAVVEELDVAPVSLLEGRVRGRAKVLPLSPGRTGLRRVLRLDWLHLLLLSCSGALGAAYRTDWLAGQFCLGTGACLPISGYGHSRSLKHQGR